MNLQVGSREDCGVGGWTSFRAERVDILPSSFNRAQAVEGLRVEGLGV